MSKNRIVCACRGIDKDTIEKAIANGAKTVDDIRNETTAATGCGYCSIEINEMIEAANSQKFKVPS